MRKMFKKLQNDKSHALVYKNKVMSLQELSYNFTRQKPYFLR